jgi:hypothetical protein
MWSTLPGIIVDLYQIFTLFNKADTNIKVITDIVRDPKSKFLQQAILDDLCDANVLDFIEVIQDKKYYVEYSSLTTFKDIVAETCKKQNQLFIYYTGHAKGGDLIMPDGQIIGMLEFRDLILHNCSKHAEIFIIMDCCRGTGLNLPYYLKKSVYRLTHQPNKIFPSQKIICISSTMADQDSAATLNGSFFTRSLYKLLLNKSNRYKYLPNVLTYLVDECSSQHEQTAVVHSSYPNLKMLWSWLYIPSELTISFNPDIYILLIRRISNDISDDISIDELEDNPMLDNTNVTFGHINNKTIGGRK